MRFKKLLVIAVLGLGTLNTFAAESSTYWNDRFRYDRESATLYNANELTLDLFGTYADRNRFNASSENFGGGAGINYFFTRNIGIGADSYLEEWRWPYRVDGSLILPLPIDKFGLAPYIFGGKGAPTLTGRGSEFLPASVLCSLVELRTIGDECFAQYRLKYSASR